MEEKKINLTIDRHNLSVPEGMTILEAARLVEIGRASCRERV